MEKREPLLISVVEAARRLGVGKSTLYEWIACGEFPHVRVRETIRVEPDAIPEWVRKHRVSYQS